MVPPGDGAQEPPRYVLARASMNLPGLHRDTVAIIDTDDPVIQRHLRSTALVILDEAEQLPIEVDARTMEPSIKETPGGN